MRRPLCALALAVTAVMYLVLRFLPPALPDYAEFDGSTVRLQGRVLSKEYRVSKNGVISLLITLGNIHCPSGPPTKNHVLVRVPVSENDNKTEYEGHMSHIPREFPEAPEDDLTPIGALICVTGKVRAFETARNPGEFDARLYYRTLGCDYSISGARVTAVNGKRSVIGDTLYRLRRAMAGVFDRCLSQEDASVMKALLLGEKGWLDQETKDLYRRSGIIHILAVSGLHISLVGLGITGLLRQIHAPKCLQRLLAPLVVSIYCLMAGPGPSSVRALIMYLTGALGYRIGRTPDFLTSLSLAEILLLIRQPLYLYHTGFLFSFAAALSIGALMPVLPGKAGKTLAIPALTLPVYMVSGYTFPLAGVFLNFLVLPFMQTLMISGGAVLAAGFLSVRAGRVTSLCCHVILYFYKALCTICRRPRAACKADDLSCHDCRNYRIFAVDSRAASKLVSACVNAVPYHAASGESSVVFPRCRAGRRHCPRISGSCDADRRRQLRPERARTSGSGPLRSSKGASGKAGKGSSKGADAASAFLHRDRHGRSVPRPSACCSARRRSCRLS